MPDRKDYFKIKSKEYREKNREVANRATSKGQSNNRGRRNAYARQWQAQAKAENPEGYNRLVRHYRLRGRYGIGIEEYETLLAQQGGHCALCERAPEQERYRKLNVDHCHETGRIRGLLCTPHNSAVAALGDNEAGLLKALQYIRGPSATET